MNHTLRGLMLADGQMGSSGATAGAMVALVIVAVGIFFMLTPTEHFLRSDRRTGYWFYSQEMKASGDKKRAVAAAGVFYKVFGGACIAFGMVVFLVLLVASFTQ